MSRDTESIRRTRLRIRRGRVLGALCGMLSNRGRAHGPSARQPLSAEQLKTAIGKLGDLDYATRTVAARTVRRAPAAQTVPVLLQTVAEDADGYVGDRALAVAAARL